MARGRVRLAQRVENGLVVFVHEDRHSLAGLFVQRFEQMAEARGGGFVAQTHVGATADPVQLRHDLLVQMLRPRKVAAAEVETQHRIANRPVPVRVDGETPEQFFAALEQLLEGIQKQALPEPPRA